MISISIGDVISSITKVLPSEHNVQRVNSIKYLYPQYRQDSKVPTFALTYNGTYITLMQNVGLSKKVAKSIEASYHKLYKVSDDWVSDKIKQASIDGYITVAFGLRLRTPLLKQVVLGNSKTPYEAASESRTAGNALGQSWCMLNNRSASEFMSKVRSELYSNCIKPCAHIHDAQYYLIKDNIRTLMYVNKYLVKAIEWQDDPLIKNDDVKMSGELSIFYPHWGNEMVVPNNASIPEIKMLTRKHTKQLE